MWLFQTHLLLAIFSPAILQSGQHSPFLHPPTELSRRMIQSLEQIKNIQFVCFSRVQDGSLCCWNPFVRSSHHEAVGAAEGAAASIANVVCNCFKSALMCLSNICYHFPTVI